MIDVATCTHAALVIDEKAVRNWPVGLLPNVAMNANFFPLEANVAVSIFVLAATKNAAWTLQIWSWTGGVVVFDLWWRAVRPIVLYRDQRPAEINLIIVRFAVAFGRVFTTASRKLAKTNRLDGDRIGIRHGSPLQAG